MLGMNMGFVPGFMPPPPPPPLMGMPMGFGGMRPLGMPMIGRPYVMGCGGLAGGLLGANLGGMTGTMVGGGIGQVPDSRYGDLVTLGLRDGNILFPVGKALKDAGRVHTLREVFVNRERGCV